MNQGNAPVIAVLIAMISLTLNPASLHAQDAKPAKNLPQQLINLVRERQSKITHWCSELQADPAEDRRASLLYALGKFRSIEGIPLLVKDLSFSTENFYRGIGDESTPWGAVPAVDALIAIGEESLPSMIDVLANEDDKAIRNRAAHVILVILQRDVSVDDAQAAAQKLIKKSADKMSDQTKSARLKLASDLFVGEGDIKQP